MKTGTSDLEMPKLADPSILWPFWLELELAALIPIILWWSLTPTNILNSSLWGKFLEFVGISGSCLLFFTGIPVGIIGLRAARKMQKLRVATKVLSIINLCYGALELALLIALLVGVLFFGLSA